MTYIFSNTSGYPVITRSDGSIYMPATDNIGIDMNANGVFSIKEDGKEIQRFSLADITSINGNSPSATLATLFGQVQGVMKDTNVSGRAVQIPVFIGDETSSITTGTAKSTFRMPYAMVLTAVRASLATASSSGLPTFDINVDGTTILTTKLTIDATEKTSVTAATPAVISTSSIADDAEITIDFDVSGTGAKGAKIWLIGHIA